MGGFTVRRMTDPRKEIVEAGYDAMAEHYLSWGRRVERDPRARFVEEFSRRLPEGAQVLDLGCGAGVPSTQLLAERFKVVGVDISQAQLRLARENVPQASFIQADLFELDFPDAAFAGITALYSISHVPLEAFGPNPDLRSGYKSWCRSCCADRTRQWREANPEYLAEYNQRRRAEYRAEEPAANAALHRLR